MAHTQPKPTTYADVGLSNPLAFSAEVAAMYCCSSTALQSAFDADFVIETENRINTRKEAMTFAHVTASDTLPTTNKGLGNRSNFMVTENTFTSKHDEENDQQLVMTLPRGDGIELRLYETGIGIDGSMALEEWYKPYKGAAWERLTKTSIGVQEAPVLKRFF
jgi:hypothetical protein